MWDWISEAWNSIGDFFSGGDAATAASAVETGESVSGAYGATAGELANAGASYGGAEAAGSGLLDTYKGIVKDPVGGALLKTGLSAGIGALTNKGDDSSQIFNDQLSQLIKQANMSASQAVPTGPQGLTGSRGATDPASTAAGMSRAAPIAPAVSGTGGTQSAPAVPPQRSQTGAVKLGVRPRMYA